MEQNNSIREVVFGMFSLLMNNYNQSEPVLWAFKATDSKTAATAYDKPNATVAANIVITVVMVLGVN